MTDRTYLVREVRADLEARGIYQAALPDGNRAAWEITARVVWACRHEGARLVVKTAGQNGYTFHDIRYSHDAIAFPTGWVDCLIGAGPPDNQNEPGWGWHDGAISGPTADPFDLDAGLSPLPGPIPPEVPLPEPEPEVPPHDWSALTALLTEAADRLSLIEHGQEQFLSRLIMINAELAKIQATQAKGVGGRVLYGNVRLTP